MAIELGVYLDGSYTALAVRNADDAVEFIPLDAGRLMKLDEDEFLFRYTRWLPGYPLTRAAEKYLELARDRLDADARAALESLLV